MKFITGEGGVGKSRLAAQFAEELKTRGWNAGFFNYVKDSTEIVLSENGTLIIIDYPEEHLSVVESLLTYIDSTNFPGPLRILMLSRKPVEEWEQYFYRWHIDTLYDAASVQLHTLGARDAFNLYISALFQYAQITGTDPQQFTVEEMETWLDRDDENKRPLYILALALYCALDPHKKPVYYDSADILNALVERERARLENESKQLWGDRYRYSLELIAAVATLAGGMPLDTLHDIRSAAPLTELFPDGPAFVPDLARSDIVRGNTIPALKPDIMAAALVMKCFSGYPGHASELLWQGVSTNLSSALDRFSRLCHDAGQTTGPENGTLDKWLYDAVYNRPDRCYTIHDMFIEPPIPQSCLKTAIHVCEVLYENAPDDEHKALYKNNLSVYLADTGDTGGALEAIQDAVAIRRELAGENPGRYNPNLAMSLNNLSLRLSDTGDTGGALEAIQEAVALYRMLAGENPIRFTPDLASTLNNLSNRLANTGAHDGALEAIQEAVAIRREMAGENPIRFNPDLASSLNNLSNCLADTGDTSGALEAIQEAVAIRREMAGENPGRYNPNLARSLGVMGNVLLDSPDVPGAISAYEDSITLIRPFAEKWPGSLHSRLLQYLEERLVRARNIRDEG